MLVCVNTRWCGLRRFKVCQNVQVCVRTWCVSGCVNVFQYMLTCFGTCWCPSERIAVGQDVSLCVKTCLGASLHVSESVNVVQDVSTGVRTWSRVSCQTVLLWVRLCHCLSERTDIHHVAHDVQRTTATTATRTRTVPACTARVAIATVYWRGMTGSRARRAAGHSVTGCNTQ